jgi:xanthine dehydrogenase small subunit
MIRFLLNNQLVQTEQPATMVMLDFVRLNQRLTGTKTGCREGDCGACTVLVGELKEGKLQYKSMTSCLMPLGNAEGKHIVTVEGLNLKELNQVQRAIVEESGTQCGFCTVGFVVSLCGYTLSQKTPSYERALASIDGNICRCTGYKSLERACASITNQLEERPFTDSMNWLAAKGFVPAYFTDVAKRLEELQPKSSSATTSATLSGSNPESESVAPPVFTGGGTDLFVQRPEAMLESKARLLLDHSTLKGITTEGNRIRIGASTTAEEMLHSKELLRIFPRLKAHLKLVSSTPIRNMGTVAGNIVNGSPIGDLTAFFLALDSTLTLQHAQGQRELKLRDFYLGYKTLDKKPEEWVAAITFDIPGPDAHFNFEKVSKRTHLDIASVNSAAQLTIQNGMITEAHLSGGGVGPTPKYLAKTGEFLKGKELSAQTVREAADIAQTEIAPISDARGTETYKRLLLRQLLYAHFLALFPGTIPTTDLLPQGANS